MDPSRFNWQSVAIAALIVVAVLAVLGAGVQVESVAADGGTVVNNGDRVPPGSSDGTDGVGPWLVALVAIAALVAITVTVVVVTRSRSGTE